MKRDQDKTNYPQVHDTHCENLYSISLKDWDILDLYINKGLKPWIISSILDWDYYWVYYVSTWFKMKVSNWNFVKAERRVQWR